MKSKLNIKKSSELLTSHKKQPNLVVFYLYIKLNSDFLEIFKKIVQLFKIYDII